MGSVSVGRACFSSIQCTERTRGTVQLYTI